jgi:diguanylate cyclase (GGDEF)-like protein
MDLASATVSLDVETLFVIAICVATLLGLFLLHAWLQERLAALAWWSVAYLIGAASGALWYFGQFIVPSLPASVTTILLFVAVGMIWTGARLFHGQPIRWVAMLFGAAFWLIACFLPAFAASAGSRIIVSALIVAGYTYLTAAELRRERRKSLLRRWPAIFVPMLHGAIFLFPVALATLSPDDGFHSAARGWIAVFAIEIVLYVVGTAFVVLILAKDRTVHLYKMAATTDPLTGLLNRRGFFEAAGIVMGRGRKPTAAVSVLAFDLDHFKSVNDRYGHAVGDAVLQLFAKVARETMRTSDVIGRLGGEEFVGVLSGTLTEGAAAAERVRAAFAAVSIERNGQRVAATVSIGVASGPPAASIDTLLSQADVALYRAKTHGRNRVEMADVVLDATAQRPPGRRGVRSAARKEKGAATVDALQSRAAQEEGLTHACQPG